MSDEHDHDHDERYGITPTEEMDDCEAGEECDGEEGDCDECGEPGKDYEGIAILCESCAEDWCDPGPSDYSCRQSERKQLGLPG